MGRGSPATLIPDERGSIVAVTNASGATIAVNSYDEYGIPAATNLGRFQYSRGSRPSGGRGRPETQAWLPELGMYDYKARIYSPTLGRFMQTDPIGYGDGLNWYNYVGSDPVNFSDPLGLASVPEPVVKPLDPAPPYDDIVVNGHRDPCPITSLCGNAARQLLEEVRQLEQIGNIVEIVDGEAEIIATGQRPQSGKPCPGPLRRPSSGMMNEATNKALGSVPGGGTASPLNSEFSRVSRLPNFNSGGWRSVGSIHTSTSYEHDLGDTGKVVKVYVGDSNFGGANTVTITDPTYSISHALAVPAFELGMPVNARNAAVYLSMTGC